MTCRPRFLEAVLLTFDGVDRHGNRWVPGVPVVVEDRAPVLLSHDWRLRVGRVVESWVSDDGVLRGLLRLDADLSDRAYFAAEDAVSGRRRGVSVGLSDQTRVALASVPERVAGVRWVMTGPVVAEVSLVRSPAVPGARVVCEVDRDRRVLRDVDRGFVGVAA